jgi:hypothetical protein
MQSLWWGLGCMGWWEHTSAWGGSREGGVDNLLLGKELARTGNVAVLVAMVSFCCETWEAKHAWLLNIVRGEHFDMWDIVVSRQHWTIAFLTFPMQAKPKVNLSPRWCKYHWAGCGGGRLCNCRSTCLLLGLQLGCC